MKILFLSNHKITFPLFNFLRDIKKENIAMYSGKLALADVELMKPNLIISYNYEYILSKSILTFVHGKAINLHISLLPWNRGAHPNLWSFIEDTPKGVTIHLIDQGLDTGNILLQKEINIDERNETLESSYILLHETIQKLFRENWEKLREGQISSKPQPSGGTIHYVKNLERLQSLIGKLDWNTPLYKFKDNVNKIRSLLYEN